ncbi:unnamed protein product [Bemisia tabaci]|uniref:BMP and activin membrane-bound inhibitor n=1 Tax=Bemisia tabaci TaxID=7038 RepID=A0A9P0A051_BEMTA|nr:unnamed protein product [Bemisia tabaci]
MYFSFVSVIFVICGLCHANSGDTEVLMDNTTKAEDIRCFCDLPSCITGGYMCKSAGLGCFTESDQSFNREKARRGCLDTLPNKQQACQNVPRDNEPQLKTLVLCCASDLCNHPDTPNKSNESSPSTSISGGAAVRDPLEKLVMGAGVLNPGAGYGVGAGVGGGGVDPRISTHRPISYYTTNEIWFRAATIVIPIFGALFIFALIVLGVKILRSESLDPSGSATKLKHSKHDRFPPNLNSSTTQIIHHFQDLTSNKKMPLLKPHPQLHQQQQTSENNSVSGFSPVKNIENTNNNLLSNSILNTKNENYAKINNIDGSSGILTEILVNNNNNNNNNFSINRLSSGYKIFDIQKQTNPLLNYNLFLSDLEESNSLLQEPNHFNAPIATSESNKVLYKKAIDCNWSEKL